MRTHDEGEDAVWRRYTRYFQEGVLAAAPAVAGWARTFAVEPAEMKPMVLDLLRTIKASPPRVLAEAFFSLQRDLRRGGVRREAAGALAGATAQGRGVGRVGPRVRAHGRGVRLAAGPAAALGHEELARQYNAFREDRARRIDQRLAAQRAAAQAGPVVEVVAQGTHADGRAHQPGTPRAQR